jgi:tripartite-type tricarboxylate transporter receptor subunit TctC
MVVPFPPGGVADQSGRPLASAMERILGQPVVVNNKPGAGGAVGMASVATARPDGYTVLVALSSISIIPEADKLFGRQPAYSMEQFAPVALVTADPTVLVVPADSPWHSVKEFVEDAKKRPHQISFSSSGVYGTLHMAMAMFTSAAGIELKHVPFNGGGPALTALLGNHVQALASGPGPVLPQIKAGKLRALAVTTATRSPVLPDVPAMAEALPGYEFSAWYAVGAPKSTPADAIARLNKEVNAALADPQFANQLAELGGIPLAGSPADLGRLIGSDTEKVAQIIKVAGLTID